MSEQKQLWNDQDLYDSAFSAHGYGYGDAISMHIARQMRDEYETELARLLGENDKLEADRKAIALVLDGAIEHSGHYLQAERVGALIEWHNERGKLLINTKMECNKLRGENSDLRAANDMLCAEAVDAQRRIRELEDAQDSPDWSEAPDWATWWAKDESGECYWFSEKPTATTVFRQGFWDKGAGECAYIGRQLPPQWDRSARRRPQEQP